ncbi:MAG: hypothetical protein HQL11_06845 [Candidatus Omnitrophica bacterium]|nr:hypothetical protein [Candidatus Omnitrophota bacterium]
MAYIDSEAELDGYLMKYSRLALVIRRTQWEELKAAFTARGFKPVRSTEGLRTDLVFTLN